jgi:hypothetical protein
MAALLASMLWPSLNSFCVALSCALHLAAVVSGAAAVYAGVALLMAASCKLQVTCGSGGGASKASSFGRGCHVWTLAVICWYGTGHAPQFSSLKVSSGFAFVASFNWYICGASLFFETFAPVIVWAMYDRGASVAAFDVPRSCLGGARISFLLTFSVDSWL